MTRVVDVSAIGALVFGEPGKPWVESQIASVALIAPSLLHFELGNICWKKLRQFPAEANRLITAYEVWCMSGLVRYEAIDSIQTLGLARTHQLTFYDASYLYLAANRRADLVSLDARLARAARSLGIHAPAPHTTPRPRN